MTLTPDQKDDIRLLIALYDYNGWDWSIALEYEVRKMNGSLPHQERWPVKQYRKPKAKAIEDEP